MQDNLLAWITLALGLLIVVMLRSAAGEMTLRRSMKTCGSPLGAQKDGTDPPRTLFASCRHLTCRQPLAVGDGHLAMMFVLAGSRRSCGGSPRRLIVSVSSNLAG